MGNAGFRSSATVPALETFRASSRGSYAGSMKSSRRLVLLVHKHERVHTFSSIKDHTLAKSLKSVVIQLLSYSTGVMGFRGVGRRRSSFRLLASGLRVGAVIAYKKSTRLDSSNPLNIETVNSKTLN